MPASRGFIGTFLIITLFLLIALSAAWWVDRQQTASIVAHPSVNRDLLVDPSTGTAPLSVQFAVRRDIGTVQTVSYGDGTSADVSDFICGLEYCVKRHIYDHPGTYTTAYLDPSGAAVRSFTITVQAAP